MSPEDTAAVVSYIKQNDYFGIPCTEVPADFKEGDKYGTIEVIGSAVDEQYFRELDKILLSKDIVAERGKDIKLVYTPVHGSGYMPVTTMFTRLGIQANVVAEQIAPDPDFSTVKVPNPENKAIYDKLFKDYKTLYSALRKPYINANSKRFEGEEK